MILKKVSNLWNYSPRKLPPSGIQHSPFAIRHFLFVPFLLSVLCLHPAHAQTNAVKIVTPAPTVDLARARAWLTARVPQMLADTTTPVRVLATTAQALTDTNLTAQLRTAILARQRPDGFFTEPGTPDALYDQVTAIEVLDAEHNDCVWKGALALASRQHPDGGWSATLGKSDRADAVSTAHATRTLRWAGFSRHLHGHETSEDFSSRSSRAWNFLFALQDENTGLLGYETSSFGSWGATAARCYAFPGEKFSGLDMRRAIVAIASPDLCSYPARDALREAIRLAALIDYFPRSVGLVYIDALTSDLAKHQQTDGHWPSTVPKGNELLATANAITLLEELPEARYLDNEELSVPVLPRALYHVSSLTDSTLAGSLLFSMPAETADLLLIAPERISQTNLVALCNHATLMTALQRRFTNPETKNFNTLGWKLADIAKAARAGPITFDRIANHIADEKNIPVKNLLGTDDLTAALDTLTDKQLAKALAELEKIPVRERLYEARNAWAHDSLPALETEIAALIPPTLKPVLEKLAATSATRIRTELQKNPDTLLILDAFLALGPRGILARLSEK